MEEYCFSTPMLYTDNKGKSKVDALTILISPKKCCNSKGYECTETEYTNLLNLDILAGLLETDEHIFEPIDSHLNGKDLIYMLSKSGMSHNTLLDSFLEQWIKEKQDSDNKANSAHVVTARKPKAGPSIHL